MRIPDFPGYLKVVGPGFVWLALAQGSGELIWWPYLVAKYGTALLFLLIPSALIQYPLTYQIGRYTLMTGESIWRGFARLSKPFAFFLWVVMNISFFWFGSFVVAGGTALSELIPIEGLSKKAESTLWGYILILAMFFMLMRARRTYDIVEKFLSLVAVGTFIGLFISCLHPSVSAKIVDFVSGFFSPSPWVVKPEDYEKVITAITFMGLGGFWSLFYSYWVKGKGMGMSAYAKDDFNFSAVPDEDRNGKNSKVEVKLWTRALLVDSGAGIFGNIITTFMTCLLAFAILHPKGLFPEGYKIAVVQSEFFRGWFGELGVKLFLFASALFLIDTWIATADTVAKINTDLASYFFKVDEKKSYRIFLTIITLITCITLPIAPPGELIVISAMIGFFGMCVFSIATCVLNHIFLKSYLPESARPSRVALALILISSVSYILLFITYVFMKLK